MDNSIFNNKSISRYIPIKDCICRNNKCNGNVKIYSFKWNITRRPYYVRKRPKHISNVHEMYMCESHYTKLIYKNCGVIPEARGWDWWDAMKSLIERV